MAAAATHGRAAVVTGVLLKAVVLPNQIPRLHHIALLRMHIQLLLNIHQLLLPALLHHPLHLLHYTLYNMKRRHNIIRHIINMLMRHMLITLLKIFPIGPTGKIDFLYIITVTIFFDMKSNIVLIM